MAKKYSLVLFIFLSISLSIFASAVSPSETNTAPVVKKIFDPSPLEDQYTSQVTSNPGDVFFKGVVVEDADGKENLAQGLALPSASSVYIEITSPDHSIIMTTLRCNSYECDNNCDNPQNQRIYVCGGYSTLNPQAEYSESTSDKWTMNAVAIDLSGDHSSIVSAQESDLNNLFGEKEVNLSPITEEKSSLVIILITLLILAVLILIAAMVKVAKRK